MVGDGSREVVGEQTQILLAIQVPHSHLQDIHGQTTSPNAGAPQDKAVWELCLLTSQTACRRQKTRCGSCTERLSEAGVRMRRSNNVQATVGGRWVLDGRQGNRVTHRHFALPAQVVPVEGDGGVVKLRVLVKVAVQHRHCTRAALETRAPDLQRNMLPSRSPDKMHDNLHILLHW